MNALIEQTNEREIAVMEKLWDTKDVMERLRCSRTALWRYMHCDGLPHLKLGGKTSRVQFRPEAVRKWVEEREIVMVGR